MLTDQQIDVFSKAGKYPCIRKVGVFGSRARNEETNESDIDIMIDYDFDSETFLEELDDYLGDVEKEIPGKIDYITLPGLMYSKNEDFRQAVLRDVKWIYINSETN